MSTQVADGLDDEPFPFQLSMLALDHLEVDRLGFMDTPGTYHWTTEFRVTDEDEFVLCLIVNEVLLQDPQKQAQDGEFPGRESCGDAEAPADVDGPEPVDIARIHMAHMGVFKKGDRAPISQEQRAELVEVTRMSVQPLFRAQVLASTGDLGAPPLTLPLLLRGQLPPATDLEAEIDTN